MPALDLATDSSETEDQDLLNTSQQNPDMFIWLMMLFFALALANDVCLGLRCNELHITYLADGQS